VSLQGTHSTKPICVDGCAPGFTPRTVAAEAPKLRAGGVNAVLTTVASTETPEVAISTLNDWWTADKRPTTGVQVATTVPELRKIVHGGDLAVVLHFQGTAPIGPDLEMVDTFHRLGVRVMQPTYNYANLVGDGCLEERDAGLTQFGRQVVARMQEVGIAVDLSHVGRRACLDVLEMTQVPVIASHSNARSVCDHPRNLTDEVIDGVARSGGVIDLVAYPRFVSADEQPTLEQLLDHATYISDRVGSQHVGIGLDFVVEDEYDFEFYQYDPRYYARAPYNWPTGISWWNEFGNLRPALRARGFSQQEIDGILGENLLSTLDTVWSTTSVPEAEPKLVSPGQVD
jgi:membrane dipeptidase